MNAEGNPETLQDYRDIAALLGSMLGKPIEENEAVKLFDQKIAEQGPNERVIQAESQMIFLIQSLILK